MNTSKVEVTRDTSWNYGRPPWMLGAALFIAGVLWLATQLAMSTVLIPAKFSIMAPDQKVALVASLSAIGAIVSLVATIIFGAMSDLTRSRFGRRVPWMIFGSVGCAGTIILIISAPTPTLIIAEWALFQVFLAAIVAPIVAVIPDRVPDANRGAFSSVYGSSMMVGGSAGMMLASRFVTDPNQGMIVVAVMILLSGPAFALLAPDQSNKDVPVPPFTPKMILHNFSFPVKHSRDFYLALFGKLFFVIGSYMISGYQLYILTDYMLATPEQAGNVIAIMSMINLSLGLLVAAIAGPISDRVGKRKIFVIGAAVILAIGTILPLTIPQTWTMIVFAVFLAVGGGIFNSVDQAINYDVLPDPETAAKDLGIINMANTGGQVLGPLAGSAVVALTGGFAFVFLTSGISMIVAGTFIKFVKKSR